MGLEWLEVFSMHWNSATEHNRVVNDVKLFWKTKVNVSYCNSKINHLEKVITKVISITVRASGY